MKELTQTRLKSLLHYEKGSGNFIWKVRRQGTKGVDSIAGSLNGMGYINIVVDGKIYLAHRLAFFYVKGIFPKDIIDHKNRDKSDNSWDNLRSTSQSINCENSIRSNNFNGVWFNKSTLKWHAHSRSSVKEKRKYLGQFNTHIAACYARHQWEIVND